MHTAQNALTWFAAITLLTALIPGITAGILARARCWRLERTRDVARWFAACLSITWWAIALYELRIAYPYDWIGATIRTPVRVLAFTAWCFSSGYFAPLIAQKVLFLKGA